MKQNAKYRLRDERGRFVPKIFNEQVIRSLAAQKNVSNFKGEGKAVKEKKVNEIIEEAKISPKELHSFYKQNNDLFLDMLHTGSLKTLPQNSGQLEKTLSKYKGEIILNGESVTRAEAKLALLTFKQALSTEINAVDFTIQSELSFDGKMSINIPSPKHIIKELVEYFGVESPDGLDEFTGAEITEALGEILNKEYGEGEIVIYAS